MLLALLLPALAAPSDALDRLIAGASLDERGLVALAEKDPATAWQLVDPASRAALDYVLGLPAAEIRKVREGQPVIRWAGEGSDAEWSALWRLAEALDVRPRSVRKVHVHTEDAAVLRVELELRRGHAEVGIAWPPEALPPRAAVDLREVLGVDVAAPVPLVDGGFEAPWSAGLAWEEDAPPGTRVVRDGARAKAGAVSLRLESHTRAVPSVTQVLDVRPGDKLLLTGVVAGDGTLPVVTVTFRDGAGEELDLGEGIAGASGWTPLTLDAVVPDGTVSAWVRLSLAGPGAANFDDLTLRVSGPTPAPVETWARATSGSVVAHFDPTRCAADDAQACAADAAARLDAALKSGLGRLSVPAAGVVNVWVFADPAHRAALTPRTPGGPRGFGDDYGEGTCWIVADAAWAAACPVRVMLERSWGAPGNDVIGLGLPRALAGSGVDLHDAVRGALPDVPSLAEVAASRVGGPSRQAAATSFAAWLVETQSLAAVRAAWKAADLGAYTIAGRDLAALEREWRAEVGK